MNEDQRNLDAMLETMDDQPQPIEGAADDTKKTDDATDDKKSADDSKGKPADDKKSDDDDKKSDDDKKDDGITIDEINDEADKDKKAEDDKKDEPEKPAADPAALTPEYKYILDGLETRTVADKDGKVYNIKTGYELPANFEFASDAARSEFFSWFYAQKNKAEQLQKEFQGKEADKQREQANKEWIEKEQLADKLDIADLQKSGDLDKFTVRPADKGFDDQPVVKLIESVLQYKDDLNKENFERSQKNNTVMRLVGFREALALYRYRKIGEKPEDDKKSEELKQEDAARKGQAKRTNGAQSTDSKETTPRPHLTSSRDIYNFIDQLD